MGRARTWMGAVAGAEARESECACLCLFVSMRVCVWHMGQHALASTVLWHGGSLAEAMGKEIHARCRRFPLRSWRS